VKRNPTFMATTSSAPRFVEAGGLVIRTEHLTFQRWEALDNMGRLERRSLVLTLYIPNMAYAGCAANITHTILKSDPDAKVDVDLGRGEVTVDTVAPEVLLRLVLEMAGYPARARTCGLGRRP
jgi:copper chaperone CopZ